MLHQQPGLVAILSLAAFVLGACVASFCNCAALRRSEGESALFGRSRCPLCKHVLGPLELIPLFSWLVQRKACRHCGGRISARYPATELVGGCVFAALVVADALSSAGLGAHTVQNLLFASILLYASLVDLDSRIIPNGCIVAAIVVRVLYIAFVFLTEGTESGLALVRFSLVGAFAVFIPMLVVVLVADRAFGRESMGGGDLKLFFVAGLYFGWRACLFLIIIACIAGIAGALATSRTKDGQDGQGAQNLQGEEEPLRHRAVPFGPAIAFACVVTMLVGSPLVRWYEGLF